MIELKHVSKWYGQVQVLNDCSTQIQKGEVVVVCGPSGSGKSTLIKTINALEPIQKGEIWVDGQAVHDPKTDLPKLRSRVGMVFQHFELFPHLSVTENLTLAQVKVLGRSLDDARARGLKVLDRVGLMAHKDKFPGQLSGGQQQRVAIARAQLGQVGLGVGNADAVDDDVALLDRFQRIHRLDQRALATARRAADHHHLALVDACAAVGQHLEAAVPLADVLDVDHGCVRLCPLGGQARFPAAGGRQVT
jgi:ABC-type ATPase involved in cell division